MNSEELKTGNSGNEEEESEKSLSAKDALLRELRAHQHAFRRGQGSLVTAAALEAVEKSLQQESLRGQGGLAIDEEEDKPENVIPDLPENQGAREFLKKAPSKGLWLPMGVEVKVMQCWRCKAYGHRTGDKECPLANTGNILLDAERQAREDPMAKYVASKDEKRAENLARLEHLQTLMDEIRKEQKEKKRGSSDKKRKRSKKKKASNDKKEKRHRKK